MNKNKNPKASNKMKTNLHVSQTFCSVLN